MSDLNLQRYRTTHSDATRALGQALGQLSQAGDFIACTGSLGAGKTTFIQGFAAGLEVSEDYYVRSPTFTLMQEYHGRLPVYHYDLYRLADENEVWDIGFEDYVNADGVVLVEWAEKFPAVLPAARLDIRISILDTEVRCFECVATDVSYQRYLTVQG